jgi:hypothetical protein
MICETPVKSYSRRVSMGLTVSRKTGQKFSR